jgi:hypothetical protein
MSSSRSQQFGCWGFFIRTIGHHMNPPYDFFPFFLPFCTTNNFCWLPLSIDVDKMIVSSSKNQTRLLYKIHKLIQVNMLLNIL